MFANSTSLIREIQTEALSSNASANSLLRKAKVAAVKLDASETCTWIEHELKGYGTIPPDSYPDYRKINGTLRALNPYNGWIPVDLGNNSEFNYIMSLAHIGESMASIETTLNSGRGDRITFPLDHHRKSIIYEGQDFRFDLSIHISKGQIESIRDSVINLILDWSLELEKQGVIGEGMSFSNEDKKKAATVTQQIFAQNIGTVGDISDQANVSTTQFASNSSLDRDAIKNLLDQINLANDQLPESKINEINSICSKIDLENQNDESIKSHLLSLKAVCEGITGSILAQGILSGIAAIL